MPNGLIKFFNAAKGFGFITLDEGGKDVFVPAGSVTASGIVGLTPGQQVSFDVQPDARGPKAINLKLVANLSPPPIPVVRHAPAAHVQAPATVTIYLDPNCDKGKAALDALRAAGESPHIVNYIASPPDRDELKSLSMLLRNAGQNMVRRYDPLFQELRLDDRFISDSEFWGGIFENPSLINGPIVASRGTAAICQAENSVEAFLAVLSGNIAQLSPKPKRLSGAVLAKTTEVVTPMQEPVKASVRARKALTRVSSTVAKNVTGPANARVKPKTKSEKKSVPKILAESKARVAKKKPPKKAAKKIVGIIARKKIKPRPR